MNVSTFFSTAKTLVGQHAPEIYTGIGIALSVLTPILAAKEAPKVLIEESDIRIDYDREPTTKEKFMIDVKHYWPAVLTGVSSIVMIVSGQHIQYKRTAAATAAYLLAQDSLNSFTEHVVAELGDKKVKNIKEKIILDKVPNMSYDDKDIIYTGNGDTLCYDVIGGRKFMSSVESIRKAESAMNKLLANGETFVSVNDFYRELDLDPIKFGEELGWEVALEGTVDIELSAKLDSFDRPMLVIDSDMCPRWRLYA